MKSPDHQHSSPRRLCALWLRRPRHALTAALLFPAISLVSCSPPPLPPADSQENLELAADLAAARFFLANPGAQYVTWPEIKQSVLGLSDSASIPESFLASVEGKKFYRTGTGDKSPPTTSSVSSPSPSPSPESSTARQAPSPTEDPGYGVVIDPPLSSTHRGARLTFRAAASGADGTSSFHFVTIARPSEPGVDEVPALDGDPVESPDFEESFEELGEAQVMVRAYAPDGRTARAFSKVEVTNRPPSLSVEGIPSQVHRAQTILPSIKAEDPDGDEVELEIASSEEGVLARGENPEFALGKLGESRLVLRARDSLGAVTELPVIVSVTNRPPGVTLTPTPLRAHPGQTVEIATEPTDPDGDRTSSRAFAMGGELEQTSPGVFRVAAAEPGLHEVRVEVVDEHGSTSTVSSPLEVVNRPPVIALPTAPPTTRRGVAVKLADPPVDPDGDPVTVSATIGSEEKNWKPGEEVSAAFSSLGAHEVEIVAEDSRGARSTAKLEVVVVNAPPTVELSVNPESPHRGDQVVVRAVAVDPEGEPLLYKFGGDGVPTSPTTSPETTLTPSELGKLTVSVSVSDPHGEVAHADRVIKVLPRPPEVTISASPSVGSRTNEFSATVDYRCPEGGKPPVSMKILEPSSWKRSADGFTGQFKSVGDRKIRVEVESVSGATAVSETSVTVTNLPPALEILAPSKPYHRTRPARFAVKYDDPDGDSRPSAVEWEVDGGRIVSEDALTAVIEFERLGEILVSATTTDSEGGVSTATTRPQVENAPPSIRATIPDGPHHRARPIPIKVEAFDTDGSLPPTLEVSVDGQALAPTDGAYQMRPSRLGSHALKVVAVDSDGSRTEELLSLDVENSTPTVKLSVPPDTQVAGREMTLSASASDLEGGELGYEFEVNGVRLPSNASSETKVSFASPGHHPVSVTVTDPDGAKATASGEIRIK